MSPSDPEAIVAPVTDRPLEEQIAAAVRDGVRSEAAPVGRHLAEVRGLSVRAGRQLERIEAVLGAERNARVDDLSVLVELITAGWRTVDERLARVEELLDQHHEQLGGDERVDVLGLMGAEHDELPQADAA
jgi:hypothetical protein